MESITKLFRIGVGPSSSHTMGPRRAAEKFLEQLPEAARYEVELFGSLASTGRGHLTDQALQEVFSSRKLDIIWKPDEMLPLHPNGMRFSGFDKNDAVLDQWQVYSIGGGALMDETSRASAVHCYPLESMNAILNYCSQNGLTFWEYVQQCEASTLWDFLEEIRKTMWAAVQRGLSTEGVLPGGLGVPRKARSIFRKTNLFGATLKQNGLLAAYAYAVSEENASAGIIVTAPTCGGSGVVPAVLTYLAKTLACSDRDILRALATAGLVGNLIKHNASISGAEVGCQGEVGAACAMAAAAAVQLCGGSLNQIEYAAEMGLEHHLGLTCDPVAGLVQIPCIERNAHAATRALSACHMALLSDGRHKISFDEVTAVMKETGHALPSLYRETSQGGLARAYRSRPETETDRDSRL